MTDALPFDDLPGPRSASHPEEVKRAEHVENASPIRANVQEKQQQPTPPQTPAEPNDQRRHPKVHSSMLSSTSAAPEVNDGSNESTSHNVGATEKFKVNGENDADGNVGELRNTDLEKEEGGTEKQAESPEVSIKKMQERMAFMEKELKAYGIMMEAGDEANPDWERKKESKQDRRPAVPKLVHMEWEEFKHKYANEEEVYAVEVLIGEARYYYQRVEDMKNIRMSTGKISKFSAESSEKKSEPASTSAKFPKELPERIRINSKPILSILGQIDAEEEWSDEPMVVLRPYKPLVFYDRQIREAFQKLQDRWGEAERLEDAEKAANINKPAKDTALDEAKGAGRKQSGETKDSSAGEEKKPQPGESEKHIIANGTVHLPSVAADATDQHDEEQRQTGSATAASPMIPKPSTEAHESEPGDESQPADEAKSDDAGHSDLIKGEKKPEGINSPKKERTPTDETPAKDLIDTQDDDDSKEEPEDLTNCVEALRDLRCLIEFMDNELQPVVDRLKSEICQKVYFSDLWHLFKPGELLYAPLGSKNENEVAVELNGKWFTRKPNDRIQDVWKIISTADGRANLRPKHDSDNDNVAPAKRINSFIVLASYVDFNGTKFSTSTYQHTIAAYKGERDITSLVFYPLKFAPNRESLKSKWLERGRSFKEFMTPKHRYHVGRSLTCRPTGLRPQEEDFPKHAENIDSQVVVDFSEALAANPGWEPVFALSTMMDTLYREFNEDYPVTLWKDRKRKKLEDQKLDRYYFDQRIDEKIMQIHRDKDPLTKEFPDKSAEDGDLSEECLMLLPNRVFAFVMKNRKFAILTVDGMRDIKPYRDGFKDLKLPGKHKTMVSSLVHNHFRNKKAELSDKEASHDSDIVRGKGKGLIILLHGAPGVGKTSTAETVAEAYRKPLFPITCGDLGLTASEVETELEDKFHLAELWDCVLLLDEADVFLAQRTRTDVKRNSLVSVFLRVLEYFTGILFLTTNRVGAFDEAFKSRIHISLYYPPLDWNQTLAIWEMNMGKLRDKKRRRNERFKVDEERLYRFARQHYKENRPKNAHWNGRQIRNAFQTATALAEFEAHEEIQNEKKKARIGAELGPLEPELRVEHFETVALASTEFDDYLYKLRGKTDSSRAFFDQERADQYQSAQKAYPRKTQQPTQAYQGMPPPSTPLMQQAPGMQGPQAQRPIRTQQQFSRQQQPYMDSRQQYTMNPSLHDDALSEEEEEDLKYGQSWQQPPNAFSQSDHPDDEDSWRREASPQRQPPRNTSVIRRGSYLGYSSGGPRDY